MRSILIISSIWRRRSEKYHGGAVNPKHLSMWERFVLRRNRNYDPNVGRIEREAAERKAAALA